MTRAGSKQPNVLKPYVMTLPAPNGLGEGLNQTILDRVALCYVRFRMFSLGQRIQPTTMIEFKETEHLDHTGMVGCRREIYHIRGGSGRASSEMPWEGESLPNGMIHAIGIADARGSILVAYIRSKISLWNLPRPQSSRLPIISVPGIPSTGRCLV
jgi:hypothetical protein